MTTLELDESKHADSPLTALVRQLEQNPLLDKVADALGPIADRLLESPDLRDALLGKQVGHALHPALTDLPIGAWTCTTVLDLLGGAKSRRAARLLLSFGIVTAVPTAASGLAEWRKTSGPARRLGAAHAAANFTALVLYGASLLARLGGRQARGVVLALAGSGVLAASGYLGGHLAFVNKAGTGERPAPDEGIPAEMSRT